MTQSNSNTVLPVVTMDHFGALRSAIFASRPGLVKTEPLQHDTGRAVKATISGVGEGDFVVRSVKAGPRRTFHILAGAVPAVVARDIPGFASIVDNHFIVPASAVSESGEVAMAGLKARTEFGAGDVIALEDGDSVVDFAGAVRV